MEKSSARSLVLVLLLGLALVETKDMFKDCAGMGNSVSCYGAKMVRNVVKQLASEKSLQLVPGVEIVEAVTQRNEEERAYNEITSEPEDTGLLGRITRYLTSHELKINLGEMIRKSELQRMVRTTLTTVHEEIAGDVEEARKKDKGGLGIVLMMGVMMSKVLGALGFGGVAMLAMKALGVSMMALLLSVILGLKKLTEGGGDHKGRQNDEDIQVFSNLPTKSSNNGGYEGHYSAAGESRHRRSPSLAYRGWTGVEQ
ncbi:uncharacterized protein Osi5 [Ochlerotatus camptorhynchus]|uniref:uncharacterized protein Osi5 n=1 Tax=Ochlerotatus camptorhynchus TaxID=644619 RepID=UPI0031DAD5ED